MKFTSTKIDIRGCIGTLFVAFLGSILLYVSLGQVSAKSEPVPNSTPRNTRTKKARYTEFPHNEKAHKLDCSTCHKFPSDNWKKVRVADAAFPDLTDYPKHDSCVKCHTQQFFKGTRPAICSICHTNPSPRDSSRHPFPNPREIFDMSAKGKKAESDFVVRFPHDKHIEIVATAPSRSVDFISASFARADRRPAAEESCAVCHQTMAPQDKSEEEFLTKPPATIGDAFWLKKGTFKTAPIGHTACFTCHSADTGILPAPQTCSACHQLQPPMPTPDFDAKQAGTMIANNKVMTDAWRSRHNAGTYRHEFFAHAELSCSTCHNVLTLNTADPLTAKVGIASCEIGRAHV